MAGKVHYETEFESTSLLVVEDDPSLLKTLKDILEGVGYSVKTATNGQAALEALSESQPDLILSDTSMPVMDGFELLEAVRQDSGRADVPFLFLTPADAQVEISNGMVFGADGYVLKPITKQKLLAAIQTRLPHPENFDLDHLNQEIEEISLLVVEDDLAMLIALKDILENTGYHVRTAENGEQALQAFQEVRPALILSDISMPVMDGIELFKAVRKLPGGLSVPFMFLTARGTREDIFAGMSLGVDDYITKPISSDELISAVNARLKRADELMVVQLKVAYKSSLFALANAIEARDQYTHDHVMRSNAYAQSLAVELNWDEAQREVLEFGAILHDIGKLDVPAPILRKSEPLTTDEWGYMRRHTVDGAHMIEGIDYLAPALPIILYHHECWDGSGYPRGLQGKDIPEAARLLAVVDTFEAMTTTRPYREAINPDSAFNEILNRSGRQFDPEMVEAFRSCWERGEILEIMNVRT